MASRNKTTTTRTPAAALLLMATLLLSTTVATAQNAPNGITAETSVELDDIAGGSFVPEEATVKVSSKALGTARVAGAASLRAGSVGWRTVMATAAKIIPPSGPSEGSNSYGHRPPPRRVMLAEY